MERLFLFSYETIDSELYDLGIKILENDMNHYLALPINIAYLFGDTEPCQTLEILGI